MNHNCTLGHTQYRSGKMSFNLEEKMNKMIDTHILKTLLGAKRKIGNEILQKK